MLWVIVVLFVLLWAIGFLEGAGGFIHLLLGIALVMLLIALFRDKKRTTH